MRLHPGLTARGWHTGHFNASLRHGQVDIRDYRAAAGSPKSTIRERSKLKVGRAKSSRAIGNKKD
jgi:hypothetical protein